MHGFMIMVLAGSGNGGVWDVETCSNHTLHCIDGVLNLWTQLLSTSYIGGVNEFLVLVTWCRLLPLSRFHSILLPRPIVFAEKSISRDLAFGVFATSMTETRGL